MSCQTTATARRVRGSVVLATIPSMYCDYVVGPANRCWTRPATRGSLNGRRLALGEAAHDRRRSSRVAWVVEPAPAPPHHPRRRPHGRQRRSLRRSACPTAFRACRVRSVARRGPGGDGDRRPSPAASPPSVVATGAVGVRSSASSGSASPPCSRAPAIVGVALGFGAQNLVRDVLAGWFILVEDRYGVGDTIDAGAAGARAWSSGSTLRSTRLRDVNGTVWHVANGEILRVGNTVAENLVACGRRRRRHAPPRTSDRACELLGRGRRCGCSRTTRSWGDRLTGDPRCARRAPDGPDGRDACGSSATPSRRASSPSTASTGRRVLRAFEARGHPPRHSCRRWPARRPAPGDRRHRGSHRPL